MSPFHSNKFTCLIGQDECRRDSVSTYEDDDEYINNYDDGLNLNLSVDSDFRGEFSSERELDGQ